MAAVNVKPIIASVTSSTGSFHDYLHAFQSALNFSEEAFLKKLWAT